MLTDEQAERLVAAAERIADALEAAMPRQRPHRNLGKDVALIREVAEQAAHDVLAQQEGRKK